MMNKKVYSLKRKTRLSGISMFIIYVVLFMYAFATVYPFYNVIVLSFATEAAVIRDPLMLWPKEFSYASYQVMLGDKNFIGAFLNSVFVVTTGTAYSIILTVCCAYVLTKTHVKGINILFRMVIFTMFFGGGLIPTYLNIYNLGLINTFGAIILPAGINTFYMILMINAMRDIPAELDESARMDGANDIHILVRVFLPLCLPTLMAIMLFYIVDKWNEWYSVMLYINTSERFTMTYILRSMLLRITNAADPSNQALLTQRRVYAKGLQRAAIICTVLPIMVIYPFIQKYFAKGIMVGAIKG